MTTSSYLQQQQCYSSRRLPRAAVDLRPVRHVLVTFRSGALPSPGVPRAPVVSEPLEHEEVPPRRRAAACLLVPFAPAAPPESVGWKFVLRDIRTDRLVALCGVEWVPATKSLIGELLWFT